MAISLYMDHHVPRAITAGLRLRQVDVTTAEYRPHTVHVKPGGGRQDDGQRPARDRQQPASRCRRS